jgi:hypothetical protein
MVMAALHADLQAALNTDPVGLRPEHLIRLYRRDDTPLDRSTAGYDISWAGNTWQATGIVLGIDPILIHSLNIAANWTMTLSGLDVFSFEAFHLQRAQIFLAFVREGVVVGDALIIAEGIMSIGPRRSTAETLSVEIAIEGPWNNQYRNVIFRRTDQGQRAQFSDDRIFSDVTKLRDVVVGGAGVNVFY